MNLLCMYCCEEAHDAYEPEFENRFNGKGFEQVHVLNWIYCKKCDVWTEHPTEEYKRDHQSDQPSTTVC